ncbi:Methyl-accepting chemotaxis protein, partial [Salmonella enterica subsp. enterica serovar Rubislaw str. A4-653]
AVAEMDRVSRLTQAVAVFRIQQQQQRAREVAAVKTPAAVSSPKAAVADGSDNWETF